MSLAANINKQAQRTTLETKKQTCQTSKRVRLVVLVRFRFLQLTPFRIISFRTSRLSCFRSQGCRSDREGTSILPIPNPLSSISLLNNMSSVPRIQPLPQALPKIQVPHFCRASDRSHLRRPHRRHRPHEGRGGTSQPQSSSPAPCQRQGDPKRAA